MKHGKGKRTLRAADGVILAEPRPVSPYSLKGIGRGLTGGYDSLVDATSHGIEAVAKPFSRPVGYTPALPAAPAPAAAPAVPVPPAGLPQLGGMDLGVIQRREAAAGLADGTPYVSPFSLKGIGRGLASGYDNLVDATSHGMDRMHQIVTRQPAFDFNALPEAAPVPVSAPAAAPAVDPSIGGALNAIQQRQQILNNLADGTGIVRGKGGPIDDKVPAKLSPGESVLPADTTAILGPENVQHLIDETHTPAHMQRQGMPPGGRHAARNGLRLANGVAGLEVSESPFTESDSRLFNTRPAPTLPNPQPQVPGVSVSEGGIADPGPGNPNVNRMGPQRPAGLNPLAEPAPAAVAEGAGGAAEAAGTASRMGRMAYGVGRAAATGLRAAPALLAAGELAHNVGTSKIGSASGVDDVDSSALGTMKYMAHGDWGNAGESLRKGAVEAGGDLLKAGAGLGDVFLPGTPLTDALKSRFADDGVLTDGQSSAGAGRGRINPPQAQPDAPQPQAQPGAAPQGMVTAPPLDNSVIPGGAQAGNIMRQGNSFTNTGRFIEDERAPGGPSTSDMAAADRVAARSMAGAGLRGGMDSTPNLPAGYGTNIPGVNAPASQYEQELAARNASVRSMDADRGMNANQRSQRDVQMAEMRQRGAIAGMQDSTTRRGQDVNADVAHEGHRVSLRGQDLSYGSSMFGHQTTAANARARLAYDMGKDNRDYNLRAAEFGQKRDEAAFSQSERADQAMQKDLESRYRTTDAKGNDVPDAQKIGAYRTAVDTTIPALAKALRATGNPEAVAKAQDLEKRGSAALSKDDHARLQQLFDIRDRMQQARGLGPNQGTFAQSDNLLDYQQRPGEAGVEHRTFGGNRIVTPAGSVSANDLRYADGPANMFFPDFNKVQNRNLTRGLRME